MQIKKSTLTINDPRRTKAKSPEQGSGPMINDVVCWKGLLALLAVLYCNRCCSTDCSWLMTYFRNDRILRETYCPAVEETHRPLLYYFLFPVLYGSRNVLCPEMSNNQTKKTKSGKMQSFQWNVWALMLEVGTFAAQEI